LKDCEEGCVLTDFLIGTGGWAYFQVPNVHPLIAYSRVFNFVEVNSTFYEIPDLKRVTSWRRIVPPDFEFSVRCNKELTHNLRFQLVTEAYEVLERMVAICRVLKANLLHFQTPPSFKPDKINGDAIRDFFSTVDFRGIRPILEVRSTSSLDSSFIEALRELNIVHSVDLLKGEVPVYKSDILYTRLFGKGFHNIYQPLDNELREVYRVASQGNHKKSVVTMHSNRMFKDAVRLLMYKETMEFPMVTKSTGVDSLVEVLEEDSKFPSTKNELIHHQGWKVIDLTRDERVRASKLLGKLPDKTYYDINQVVKGLEDVSFG
jgi:uncharacterized protein YecE (DUF72 family)